MSETPQPEEPGTDGIDSTDGTGASVDPQTGEDLSWKSPAVAIVLLDRPAPGHREISELLTEIFEGSYEVDPGSEDDPATAVTVDDATILATPVDAPIADGQASRYTRDLAVWNGGEAVVETHESQVVVVGLRLGPVGDDGEPTAPEYMDPRLETLRCELAVATVTAALTALPGAIAVSVGGAAATLPAGPYRDFVTGNAMPVPALVGVRAGMQSETTSCVYTSGMGRFGRMDLERLDVDAQPAEVYGQMCDLVAFTLVDGAVFVPGQTLEVGGPRPLVTSAETSPFTGQQVLRLTPGDAPSHAAGDALGDAPTGDAPGSPG